MLKHHSLSTSVTLLAALLAAPYAAAVEFGAFGNIRFQNSSPDNGTSGFVLGGLDLFAGQDIDEKTSVFVEYVFENTGDEFITDVERLWIKRSLNPFTAVSAGRFHSPLGYWNLNFHHGTLIQDTVSRPRFLDFEDGTGAILPMHLIGAKLSGGARAGLVEFIYDIGIGNSYTLDSAASPNASPAGSGIEIGLQNVADLSNDKTIAGRFMVTPTNAPVEFGVSAMTTKYLEAGPGTPNFGNLSPGDPLISQAAFGFDLYWSLPRFRFLTELFFVRNKNEFDDTESTTAKAAYTQFTYEILPWLFSTYRYESVTDAADDDAYFAILNTEVGTHHVLAFKFNFDETNAIIAEFNWHSETGSQEAEKTYAIDWAFLMF